MPLEIGTIDVVAVGHPDPQTTVPFWVGFSHLFLSALKTNFTGTKLGQQQALSEDASIVAQLQQQQ